MPAVSIGVLKKNKQEERMGETEHVKEESTQ